MIKNTASRKIRILVVDDDIDVCQYLESFLGKKGYSVKYLTDPEKAVPLLREESFQIVILDLVMPKLSGLELLDKIRRIDSDICIIILSAYPTFENAVSSFKNTVFDFLIKPFENDEIVKTLEEAIARYGLVSDLNQRAIQQISVQLRALRLKKNLSMRQLANRTGVSSSLIYQIEHAQTSPSLATMSRLATALKTPLKQFFQEL